MLFSVFSIKLSCFCVLNLVGLTPYLFLKALEKLSESEKPTDSEIAIGSSFRKLQEIKTTYKK